MKIGLLGISHLSLNHGAAFLKKGFEVVFFDPAASLVAQVEKGSLDYAEPGLKEALEHNRAQFVATDKENTLQTCDVLYIARDVPTDSMGKSDLRSTHELFEVAKRNASSTASIVLLCQVPPGFTRQLDFPKNRLFYQVETLIFGKAFDRALNPERYVVGMDKPDSPLSMPLKKVLESFACPILKMRYESAELAKISINLFLISSVSTTNTIADLCEKIGADWFEIRAALQLDKRIGKDAYLNPGLGLSGGNLERDLTTTLNLAYEHGSPSSMVQAWMVDCRHRKDWVLRILHEHVFSQNSFPKIGVLGLAYKAETNSIKNSPSLHLLESLQSKKVVAFDPVVKECPYASVKIPETMEEVLQQEVVIIMTPWKDFKGLDYSTVKTLIDPFNLLEGSTSKGPFDYYALGRTF